MKTLVLEPDRTVRGWLEAGLRSRGHAVVSRSTAGEAWTAYEGQQPRLVLLDWAGEDGPALCRRIRTSAHGDRCVVLATGLSDRPGDVRDAINLGADDYLPKMADAGALEGRLAIAEKRLCQIEERATAEAALAESERRYRSVMDAAQEVIATLSGAGTILSLNAAFETLGGWRREEWIGRELGGLLHPEDLRGARGVFQRALRGAPRQAGEARVLARSGHWRIVDYTVTGQARDGQAPSVLVVARDMTERRRERQRELVRHASARALSEAATPAEGAGGLLRALCVGLGWEVGRFWTVAETAQYLRFVALWHLPGVDVDDLLSASRAARPRPGEGRAGEAWRSACSGWTVEADMAGLRSAIAVPIRCGADVAGVIELLSSEARPPETATLRIVEGVASDLAHLIARRQAEQALRASEERHGRAIPGAGTQPLREHVRESGPLPAAAAATA